MQEAASCCATVPTDLLLQALPFGKVQRPAPGLRSSPPIADQARANCGQSRCVKFYTLLGRFFPRSTGILGIPARADPTRRGLPAGAGPEGGRFRAIGALIRSMLVGEAEASKTR